MQKCSPCRELPLEMIEQVVNEAYDAVKDMKGGKNVDYIPYLAGVDPDLFDICMTLGDGTQFSVGDTDTVFGSHICQIA